MPLPSAAPHPTLAANDPRKAAWVREGIAPKRPAYGPRMHVMTQRAIFERFIGRADELRALVEAFHAAKAQHRGAALSISAEAGVGKSRLLDEFSARVSRERCTLLRGACLEYVSTPYEPLVEAFSGDGTAATIVVRELRLAVDERSNSELERVRRFTNVERYMRRRAEESGALVLLVEDLHWSDAASLDLLRFLARRLRDAPVLLAVTSRSDELERDHARAGALAAFVRDGARELRLERLSDREIAELLRSASSGAALADDDVARIAELSEGKPLFAEELLRGVLDRSRAAGALRSDGAAHDARGSATADAGLGGAISLRAAILARLQHFGDDEQQALLCAAVVGREFDAALLKQLVPLPTPALLLALRRARNMQLVVEDATTGRFRFRHAVTREILYEELLRSEARLLHARIAETIEASPDFNADEAAYHWWAAADAARATESNTRAAERAEAMYAYADAARSYERAMAFAKADVRGELVRRLAFALCAVGDMGRASRWCADVAGELAKTGDRARATPLMLWVARQLYEAGEADRALETVAAVRADLAHEEASTLHVTAAMTLAGMFATLGRADDTLAVLAEADAYDVAREPIDAFRAHNARGNAFCSLARYAEAAEEHRAALVIAETVDDDALRLHALGNLGNIALLVGNMEGAASAYDAGIELAEERGLRRQAALLVAGRACAALELGDVAGARARCARVLANRSATAVTRALACGVALRCIELAGTTPELTDVDAERAVEDAFRVRESQVIALVCGAAAALALREGDRARARALVSRGLDAIGEPDHALWLCDVAAAVADDAGAATAQRWIFRAAACAQSPLAEAYAALFEARRALVHGDAARARTTGLRAASLFGALSARVAAASALAAAGDVEDARAAYVAAGALRAAAGVSVDSGTRGDPAAHAGVGAAGAGAGATGATAATSGRGHEPGAGAALTRREAQVAALAARGYATRAIAAELTIGERTVEAHLATVYRKLGVKSRVELSRRLGDAG